MSKNTLNVVAEELPVDTGVKKVDRRRLADVLNQSLAGTYVLYAKTHAFHWNVAGPQFYGIHKLTDEQYRTWPQRSTRLRNGCGRSVSRQ